MRRLTSLLAVATIAAALLVVPVSTAGAGGGAHCVETQGVGNPMTDAETDVVAMRDNCFIPTIARVDPGAKVTFVNEDHLPHTVTGALYVFGDMEGFSRGERSYRFAEEGTYPYVCILHPGMAGAIVVGDGKGDLAAMSVTEETYANPPTEDTSAVEAEAPATEPAGARASDAWPIGLMVLVGVVFVAVWLPRRKAPQLELEG